MLCWLVDIYSRKYAQITTLHNPLLREFNQTFERQDASFGSIVRASRMFYVFGYLCNTFDKTTRPAHGLCEHGHHFATPLGRLLSP